LIGGRQLPLGGLELLAIPLHPGRLPTELPQFVSAGDCLLNKSAARLPGQGLGVLAGQAGAALARWLQPPQLVGHHQAFAQ
jgi:hypothetical protein